MKNDNYSPAKVSKSNVQALPIGDPREKAGQAARLVAPGAAVPTVTISSRYINSRLKQFCSR